MHGVGRLAAAHASLAVGDHDTAGNYPLKMTVRGLPQPPRGSWYELTALEARQANALVRHVRDCRTMVTVQLSVPYDLSDFPKLFDGWVVTLHVPGQEHIPVVMTT